LTLGGRFVGAGALLRFYVLHCVGIPLIAAFLMAVTSGASVRTAESGPV
jgi:hypothetical protein